MSGAPTPPFFKEAFAAGAGAGYITNPIPDTTGTVGAASLNSGFPPLTMTPEISGGVPPHGQDMNGILYMISAHTVALQAGQQYKFSSSVATAVGGYAVGAIVQSTDGTSWWLNTQDANSNDPNSSGTGWVPAFSYGSVSVALSGSDVTLTPAQYRRGIIFLTGTITANINVIVPLFARAWLVINATSGSFTVTVKGASGTGTVIPQGGNGAPLGVYTNGTNVYPTVSPLSYPIDAAATANTLALRDNTGGISATAYHDSSSVSNPTVGSVIVQNSAADGTYRKISLGNLEAQMLLQNIGGALVAGQISQAAVGQYFIQSLTTNPAQAVMPQGSDGNKLKIEMGSLLCHTNVADASTYPIAIPFASAFTAPPFVVCIANNSAVVGLCISSTMITAKNASGFTAQTNNQTGGPTRTGAQNIDWIAIGY